MSRHQLDSTVIDRLKQIVFDYIRHGERPNTTKLRLFNECDDPKIRLKCRKLYQLIPIEQHDLLIELFLFDLGLTESDTRQLLDNSSNLYELLKHLSANGHQQVRKLLQLIDNTSPTTNWTNVFFLATLGSAALLMLILTKEQHVQIAWDWITEAFPFITQWLSHTFSLLSNIPLLGMAYNSTLLIWGWYQTFSNGTMNTTEKLSTLLFKTITATLNITAYACSYAIGGAMTLPGAILFVLSAGLDIVQSATGLVHSNQALKKLAKPSSYSSSDIQAQRARVENHHQQTLQSLWIKVIAGLLITATVGIWCFFPPSFLVTIGCISFIALTSLTKWSILSSIEDSHERQLQARIRDIKRPSLVSTQTESPLKSQPTPIPETTPENDPNYFSTAAHLAGSRQKPKTPLSSQRFFSSHDAPSNAFDNPTHPFYDESDVQSQAPDLKRRRLEEF